MLECSASDYADGGTAGVTCSAGDLSRSVMTVSAVDANAPATYTVTYDVTDPDSNAATQVTRTVNVVDTTPPVITLVGANPQTLECSASYTELGATASDTCAGNLTSQIVIDASAVQAGVVGSYTVTY